MAYYFRASPSSDRISWGDTTFWDGLSAVSTSIWVNVDAVRTSNEDYWRKDGSFTPMQWAGSLVVYRVAIWINGSLTAGANYGNGVVDVWSHYFCTWSSADNTVRPYRNNTLGTTAVTGAGSISNSANAMVMGRTEGASGEEVNGAVAEAAVWNVVLDATERAALAAGVCPLLIRPSALVFYSALDGRRAIGIVGSPGANRTGITATVSGAIFADHPRIFYPSRARAGRLASAAAGGATVTPAVGSAILAGLAPSRVIGTVLTPVTP